MMQDGKEWALYSEDASGHRVPQGNQCKRCYDVHTKGFCHMSWDELVEAHGKDDKIKAKVQQAFAVHAGTDSSEWPSEEINHSHWIGLEVKRDVLLMTEREMKREANIDKLTKKHLKSIPSFKIFKEDGSGMETVWAFKDERTPFRRGTIKVMHGTSLKHWTLEDDEAMYPAQGQAQFPHFTAKMGAHIGFQEWVEKEAKGSLQLPSWDAFLMSLQDDEKDECADDEALAMAHALREAEVKMVGAAAAATVIEASVGCTATPEGIKKKKNSSPKFGRAASSSSLAGTEGVDEAAGGSEHPSHGASSVDGASVGDSEYTGQITPLHIDTWLPL